MSQTYLLSDFQNSQGKLKHITIGLPNKKSGWRINLQIAGIVTKSISLNQTPLNTIVEKLFPTMLENKTDLTNTSTPDDKKISAKKLKEKYRVALTNSLKAKKTEFEQREKIKPLKKQKTLSESIFKKSGEPKYYKIREPYKNTSISIQITKNDYSKNFSLAEHTIKHSVDTTFHKIVKTLDCKYSKSEYIAVKVTLINKLTDQYDKLCREVGKAGLNSKFNSLAGEFYKNGKWKCFSLHRYAKNTNYTYIKFVKAGKAGASRSIDLHGFTDAFEETFKHGCKQVGIHPDSIGMQPIKALLKNHLLQQINTTLTKETNHN